MVSRLFCSASILILGLCALPSLASAETVAVFPHAGDSRLEAARAAAHREVVVALREQGMTVRAVVTRPSRSPADFYSECIQVLCAPAMLTAGRIDLAVAVAVWYGEDGPQTNITLVDAAGNKFPGYAIVVTDDFAKAARAALLDARSLQLLGPGPWIHVRGNPAGADVIVDGKSVGVLPYRGALSPGDHDLKVAAAGFAAKEQRISVPFESTTTANLHVELKRDLAPGAAVADTAAPPQPQPLADYDEPATTDEASPWNFVLGGTLAAAGLALATIQPIPDAIEDGDCADKQCKEEYEFGSESIAKVVVGTVLVGAGVTVMIWQPLRVTVELDGDTAALHARMNL
jgi:hypothetical protein